MTPRIERHDLHGQGGREHEVYDMPARPPDDWAAVTDVPCPVEGCAQTVLWYEAGYVPGYRVCMARIAGSGAFDLDTIRHRFLAGLAIGCGDRPNLIRDDCCEREKDDNG